MCEFRAKIPSAAFNICACSLQRHFADIQGEKFFSKCFPGKQCEKHVRNWSGIVSFVLLSMKKTVESWHNNSGRGKTERDVSLSCAFSELLCLLFKPNKLKLIFKPDKQLRFLVVLELPHILTLIIFLTNNFTNKLILRFRCHFAVCSDKF